MVGTASPLLPIALTLLASGAAAQATVQQLVSSWNLNAASFNFSMPSTTLDSTDANSWISSNWGLSGKVSFGQSDIVFSPDPSTSSSTLVRRADSSTSTSTKTKSSSSSTSSTATTTASVSYPASTDLAGEDPVLRIMYPQGSYSKQTGGTQFVLDPLKGDSYQRMMMAYDVWFPAGYAWNMGGKLPGLRGGPDTHGCSGGNETDGSGCFSTRLMWRTGGAGEVYAYVPTTLKGFCSESEVTCNSDYGTSLARGSFAFATGQWQTIYLVVVLNSVGTANGVVELYYNGVKALSFSNLEIRSASSLNSITGIFFSTFFGGDDSSWATPTTQYTYFRNLQLYGGSDAANGTGTAISAAARGLSGEGAALWSMFGGLMIAGVVALLGMAGLGI